MYSILPLSGRTIPYGVRARGGSVHNERRYVLHYPRVFASESGANTPSHSRAVYSGLLRWAVAPRPPSPPPPPRRYAAGARLMFTKWQDFPSALPSSDASFSRHQFFRAEAPDLVEERGGGSTAPRRRRAFFFRPADSSGRSGASGGSLSVPARALGSARPALLRPRSGCRECVASLEKDGGGGRAGPGGESPGRAVHLLQHLNHVNNNNSTGVVTPGVCHRPHCGTLTDTNRTIGLTVNGHWSFGRRERRVTVTVTIDGGNKNKKMTAAIIIWRP
jgi:hypothetical protein